jgi:integrase/recombinase XerC
MSSFKIEIKKKSGLCNVYLRVTQNRKRHYISLGLKIQGEFFSTAKGQVSKKHPNDLVINNHFSQLLFKAQSIELEFNVQKIPFTIEKFRNKFLDREGEDVNFQKLIDRFIDQTQHSRSQNTIKSYVTEKRKLERYSPDLKINQISVTWLEKYDKYLTNVEENKINTRWRSMKFIRTVLNWADRNEIYSNDVFKRFKIKQENVLKEFLNSVELNILKDYFFSEDISAKHKNVLSLYLFCCFTGMRYSDGKMRKLSEFNNNVSYTLQLKTNEAVNIPVNKMALQILEEVEDFKETPSNQKCNVYLKDIAEILGIKKHLTTHTARHTFAVNSLEFGIPLKVVSKLLGHKSIRTTEIYSQIRNEFLKESVSKWDEHF